MGNAVNCSCDAEEEDLGDFLKALVPVTVKLDNTTSITLDEANLDDEDDDETIDPNNYNLTGKKFSGRLDTNLPLVGRSIMPASVTVDMRKRFAGNKAKITVTDFQLDASRELTLNPRVAEVLGQMKQTAMKSLQTELSKMANQ
eukprot:TRINITY_DN66030_c0_g1_i1.p1 TRINITY_DN66030_c0_g1~~TRINITY_DN66030_c0_g1_i1.p1  ORF type:complete len:144 (+),score=32.75 TRINITY_DN66030_c0_g1_i1:57-488(+)